MISEVVANSWEELNEYLFADTWNSAIQRHRSTFAYRGVQDASFRLLNGLSRLGKPYPNMERNLIKQFKKYAHQEVRSQDTDWHWLSIAQHYGLPTRLLDWTYAPLIATHFATADTSQFNRDGAVWKVNFSEVHDLLSGDMTANLADLGARIFSVDALAKATPSLEDFEDRGSKQAIYAAFFEPPALDGRIINQFAYFSVLTDPFLSFDDWLLCEAAASSVSAHKIIIPSGLKWEVRDKLDQSNINERVLMTGLDGLCSWLKRHYTPR